MSPRDESSSDMVVVLLLLMLCSCFTLTCGVSREAHQYKLINVTGKISKSTNYYNSIFSIPLDIE